MEFKIGTIAKMTGLSPSGIRFLEQQGVLSPSGGRKGRYRSYSMSDVSTILDYRNYRKSGLSQDEILKLLHSEDEVRILDQRCDELEREIHESMRLLHFLRHRSHDASDIRRADSFCELTTRPAIIWMPLEVRNGKPSVWPENSAFEIPYADSVLRYSVKEFLEIPEGPVPEPGVGMFESDILNLGYFEGSNVRKYDEHPAVHCIVEVNEDFTIHKESLERSRASVKDVLAKNELEMSMDSPVLSKRILTVRRDGKNRRYDHLWINVKNVSDND